MDAARWQERGQERRSESESASSEGHRLSMGAVQELQGEIAALRGVLSAMVTTVPHGRPAISEALPGYEEVRGGKFDFSDSGGFSVCELKVLTFALAT